MGKAESTHGTKLKRGDTYVAHLTNISPPELTRDDREVTDHDSPNDAREFAPGLINGGEVPIEGYLYPTESSQMSLPSAFASKDLENWTIETNTTPKVYVSFEGYVNAFKLGDAPIDGNQSFTGKIKVSGLPTIATDVSTGLTALVVTGVSSGALTLMPDLAAATKEYFATADNLDATITVAPTAAEHTITVNGTAVTSGQASGNIALTAGEITTITIKAAQTGKAPVIYTLKVFRAEA